MGVDRLFIDYYWPLRDAPFPQNCPLCRKETTCMNQSPCRATLAIYVAKRTKKKSASMVLGFGARGTDSLTRPYNPSHPSVPRRRYMDPVSIFAPPTFVVYQSGN